MKFYRLPRARRIRTAAAQERGAVAVIVAVMLVVLLGFAALAIDLSSFFQAQRQAQAAADAGALAGAEDVVSGSGSATVTSDATSLAQQNFPGASVGVDNTSNPNQVTVTVTAQTPVFFGKLLGLASETVGGRAVAGKSDPTSCPNPAVGSSACASIFSADPSCSPAGLNFQGGGINISGGIWTNGSALNSAGTNATFSGPLTTGNSAGCAWSGGTGASTVPVLSSPPATWPVDYGADFPSPSCTGAGCSGPGNTPPFCTDYSILPVWNVTAATGHIYCGVGTGIANNPATWNSAVSVSLVGGTMLASYLGGTVSLHGSSNPTFEPCGYAAAGFTSASCPGVPKPSATLNYPLVYATSSLRTGGSTGSAAYVDGGNSTIIGDVFAPNGLLTFTGGGTGDIGFLEGYDVTVKGGGLSGDGPSNLYPPQNQQPTASLLQ